MNWREIVIGGLLLPLELYFQPSRFRKRVHALAPELDEDYSLWQARKYWKKRGFLQGVTALYLEALVSFVWAPIVVLGWSIVDIEVSLSFMVLSLLCAIAMGIIISLTLGLAFSVLINITSAIAIGIGGDISLSLATILALGLMLNIITTLSASPLFILVFAVMTSIIPVLSILLRYSEISLANSFIIGLIIFILLLHLWLYPLWFMLHHLQMRRIRSNPNIIISMWRWHPVHLDDIIFPPLFGLDQLLRTCFEHDQQVGLKVIHETTLHPTQNWAAWKVQKLLMQNIAEQAQTITEIAAFNKHDLMWPTVAFPFSKEEQNALIDLKTMSRWVAAALESELPSHQIKWFEKALQSIGTTPPKASRFHWAVKRWYEILIQALEQAKQEQQRLEPIPNSYQYYDQRFYTYPKEVAEYPTFKGRDALFQQIEKLIDEPTKTFLLIGESYSGKTATLLQLNQRLRSKAVVVFFDQFYDHWEDVYLILRSLTDQICEQVQREHQIQLPRLELKDHPDRDLDAWFDQLEVLLPYHLLICLDEHINFSEALFYDWLDQRFLTFVATQPRHQLKFLFSGTLEIDELPDAWANALINTVKLRISFLERAETMELIRRPIREFPDIYTADAVDRIIKWTHCQPYLVQLTCSLLVDQMNRARRMPPESYVTVDDVEAVIPLIFERGENYFYDQYRAQSGGPDGQALLDRMARSPNYTITRADMSAIVPDERGLRLAIRTMTRREMIHAVDGDRYQITVPLFARYVAQLELI